MGVGYLKLKISKQKVKRKEKEESVDFILHVGSFFVDFNLQFFKKITIGRILKMLFYKHLYSGMSIF